ncbi:MAG: hypothetical protein HYY76_18775 [Acidobacteria bacterium]|nr:hypothetical protein [Acidobacteriota bacterium]
MADRTLALPAQLLRRLLPPAALGALAALRASALGRIRRRTRGPALPRMSDEWLRNLDHDTGRFDQWRDSW